MSKYVKVEDVLALKRMSIRDNLSIYSIDAYKVEMMPAADVRENVHGEWVVFNGGYICSKCRENGKIKVKNVASHYCPDCGADMRGKK